MLTPDLFLKRPISLFWIVYFRDGTAISEFDSDTGQERLYADVLKYRSAIIKAGWYPFPPKLAKVVTLLGGRPVRMLPADRKVEVEIGEDSELVLMKRRITAVGARKGNSKGGQTWYVIGQRGHGRVRVAVLDEDGNRAQPPGAVPEKEIIPRG